jgi:hypothetical protein
MPPAALTRFQGGDVDGCATWQRIANAIDHLQAEMPAEGNWAPRPPRLRWPIATQSCKR